MANGSDPAYPEKKDRAIISKWLEEKHPELCMEVKGLLEEHPGLTKREFFAAMAMNGLTIWDAIMNRNQPLQSSKMEAVAQECVAFADALIKELNK